MKPDSAGWATAVRVLALLSAVLLAVVVLEGWKLRRARAELQQLRTERERVKEGVAEAWGRQSDQELRQAVQWLDGFYAEQERGFGRAGGLCSGGRLDGQAIASGVAGFLRGRASGASVSASITAVRSDLLRTDAYRALHPNLALPPGR